MQILNILKKTTFLTAALLLIACGGSAEKNDPADSPVAVSEEGQVVATNDQKAATTALPYSPDSIREHVVMDYGKRALRLDSDATISRPELVKNKRNCFIVMSKKDYYLYVYEAQGKDTVLIARYDCCFALKKGNKQRPGDMRTPHCTMKTPFSISQIVNASSWHHDFKDGRGNIKAYGDWFLRLVTPGHRGIGIHGSTNNRASVPGRASEGCIRLRDEDIVDLKKNYAFNGMKVVIKAENVDDYPFEIHAMQKQHIERRRHLDPAKTLTNEAIAKAPAEKGFKGSEAAVRKGTPASVAETYTENAEDEATGGTANKTLDELDAETGSKPAAPSPAQRNMTLEEISKRTGRR